MNFEKNIWKLKKDFEKWKNFLNKKIGVFAFLLGLACLGTNYPQWYALVCLCLMGWYMQDALKNFPKSIKSLRENEETLIRIFDKSFFNLKSIIKECPIYFFGWLFLGLIANGFIK